MKNIKTHREFIQIEITKTFKYFGRNRSYCSRLTFKDYGRYDIEYIQCKDMKEAKAKLKDLYGKCSKTKMYRDASNSEAVHIGYIYSRKNSLSGGYERDWVSFNYIGEVIL